MKIFKFIGALILIILFSCQKQSNNENDSITFQYAPPEWQTAICLPDDPHKSLVDKSGELLYHYRQGGREFGTRIGIALNEGEKWVKQELYSAKVPLIKTSFVAQELKMTQLTFADTEVYEAEDSDSKLRRIDDGDYLSAWADPDKKYYPSIRDIAVHMGGNIAYEYRVQKGEKKTIALVLCEGYWSETGKRIQTLSVEGASQRTMDLVQDIGHNEVASYWFDGRDVNQDGKIMISVDANGSDKNTVLNSLFVFAAGTEANHDELVRGKMKSLALATIEDGEFIGPARDDIVIVQLKNTGKVPQTVHPIIRINSFLPFEPEIPLEGIDIESGETKEFAFRFRNGETDPEKTIQMVSIEDANKRKEKAIAYWENNNMIPSDKIEVPDQGIQSLLESSIRNIWQAREIKKGLPAFQVGPTCYRGLWIVDGAFLLEAAAMLGAGDQARNGVAYELTTQREDGRIQSLAPDFWKENGIVLWTCFRHAQLTQDKAWLESIWPQLKQVAEFICTLREWTLDNESELDDGLHPAGTLDGGIGGTHDEYTNTYWNLTGLNAFIQAAHWLGKTDEAGKWQKEFDDFYKALRVAAERDEGKDPHGNLYLPIVMGDPGKKYLPQRAQWAFCHAVYPGQIFSSDDPLANGNLDMLEATEKEGMVYGTGWDPIGIWNYFASFYGHAQLWMGNGQKAAQQLFAFGNHAAPTLVWREEQSLKGAKFRKVGDMPHNWASAEFIRLAIHLIAIDRGNELHLFEGLPKEWTKPGMVTKLNGIATPFGDLSLKLKINSNGKKANLTIEPLPDFSCEGIVLHTKCFGQSDGELIQLDPGKRNKIALDVI